MPATDATTRKYPGSQWSFWSGYESWYQSQPRPKSAFAPNGSAPYPNYASVPATRQYWSFWPTYDWFQTQPPSFHPPANLLTGSRVLALWNGSSNNAEPANWQFQAFDDSGWSQAFVTTFPGGGSPVTSLSYVMTYNTSTTLPRGSKWLYRQRFQVDPSVRTANLILLKINAADQITATWVNGVMVGSGALATVTGTYPVAVLQFSPAILYPTTPNVIAIEILNQDPGGGTGPTCMSFNLTIQ